MTLSGVLLACRPEFIPQVTRSVNDLGWAEVHFTEDTGRMVLTIEADDVRQSVDRLTHIKGLPRVISAEMAETRVIDHEDQP